LKGVYFLRENELAWRPTPSSHTQEWWDTQEKVGLSRQGTYWHFLQGYIGTFYRDILALSTGIYLHFLQEHEDTLYRDILTLSTGIFWHFLQGYICLSTGIYWHFLQGYSDTFYRDILYGLGTFNSGILALSKRMYWHFLKEKECIGTFYRDILPLSSGTLSPGILYISTFYCTQGNELCKNANHAYFHGV
jgi:hypothetical protein